MQPIIIKKTEAVEYKEIDEQWTTEDIRELFGDDASSLVIQLLNRCEEYEREVEELKKQLNKKEDKTVGFSLGYW